MWIKRKFFALMAPAGDDGADAGGGGETIGTGNDARVALLNSINDGLDEQRADELANVNDDDTTEPFRAAKDPDPEDSAADGEGSDADANPGATEPPAAAKHKIKVNGRELELTTEELIARAQKVEAADEYLRQAKQTTRAVEQPSGPSQEELQRLADEEDLALVRAIQMGTENEAAAALRKLRAQASARPSITPDDVSRTIDERLAFNAAITKFRTEYEDIVSDPFLNKLALDRDNELLASGDTRSYAERYDEIGKTIRAWKSTLAPAPAPAASNAQKLERKAAAPAAPVAASAKKAAPVQQDDDSDEPVSSVIAGMAKSRGGPQWMRS